MMLKNVINIGQRKATIEVIRHNGTSYLLSVDYRDVARRSSGTSWRGHQVSTSCRRSPGLRVRGRCCWCYLRCHRQSSSPLLHKHSTLTRTMKENSLLRQHRPQRYVANLRNTSSGQQSYEESTSTKRSLKVKRRREADEAREFQGSGLRASCVSLKCTSLLDSAIYVVGSTVLLGNCSRKFVVWNLRYANV